MSTIYSPFFTAIDENDFKNQFQNLSSEKKESMFLHENTFFDLLENNHPNLVKYLIEQGMNVNHYCDKEYKVTSFMAIMEEYWRNKDLIYFFVEKGVNLNLQDCDSKTALYRAIADMDLGEKNQQNDIIYYLFSQPNVDLNIKSYRDDTYIKRAIHFGETELALFLIKLGCDLTDPHLIEVACENKDIKILKQLILHHIPQASSENVINSFPELKEFIENVSLRDKLNNDMNIQEKFKIKL